MTPRPERVAAAADAALVVKQRLAVAVAATVLVLAVAGAITVACLISRCKRKDADSVGASKSAAAAAAAGAKDKEGGSDSSDSEGGDAEESGSETRRVLSTAAAGAATSPAPSPRPTRLRLRDSDSSGKPEHHGVSGRRGGKDTMAPAAAAPAPDDNSASIAITRAPGGGSTVSAAAGMHVRLPSSLAAAVSLPPSTAGAHCKSRASIALPQARRVAGHGPAAGRQRSEVSRRSAAPASTLSMPRLLGIAPGDSTAPGSAGVGTPHLTLKKLDLQQVLVTEWPGLQARASARSMSRIGSGRATRSREVARVNILPSARALGR